jgi:PEP-CTERM/exosortase A-associated glycosyltransferase
MKILHILDHSLPLHSGYTFRTAALLREQRRLGWETYHLTSPKQGKVAGSVEEVDGLSFFRTQECEGGVPIVRELRLMGALRRRIAGLVTELRPDILHAHSPVLNALPALHVGRRMGIPVVYEVRAFWEDAAVDHGTTREASLRYRLTRATETFAFRGVDHVFTICDGLRGDIVARGIAANKVTVIANAVDVGNFQLSGAPDAGLKASLGLQGHTVLGFVGSYYAYEGLDLLLDAFPAMHARNPDLRIVLVGGGPQEANLKAQAMRLGVADKVVFVGRVPHADVARYYDLIDLLVYPRHSMRLTELVTPLKPLEAMAQGRIFVASDVGGHRELVRDGETGFLFPADDTDALARTIESVLARRAEWPAVRAAGRRFVESERTWQRSAQNYVDVYASVLARRKST